MPSRRNRRRKGRRHPSADAPPAAAERVSRSTEKRRAEFERGAARLRSRRTILGALGLIPLAISLGCSFGDVALFCAVPSSVLLLAWAAFFGTYLGLTIRLVLERRRFERGEASGRSAS